MLRGIPAGLYLPVYSPVYSPVYILAFTRNYFPGMFRVIPGGNIQSFHRGF